MTENESDLWSQCRNGSEPAREALILKYLPLVDQQVKRLKRRVYWADASDLRLEGVRGLIWAIDRFDPDKCAVFEAYARNAIRGAVLRNPEVDRNLKRNLYETYRKVDRSQDKLIRSLGRQPELAELAQETGFSIQALQEALDAMLLASSASSEALDSEAIGIMDDRTEPPDIIVLVHELLGTLPEDDRWILIDFYWNDCTDSDIARNRGQTAAAVKKKRQRALAKLRALVEDQ